MSVQLPVGFGIATIRFKNQGSPFVSVVTFAYDPPALAPASNAAAIDAMFSAAGRPGNAIQMGPQWSYLGVAVTEMDDTGPIGAESVKNVVGIGTIGTPAPNFAMLIRKQTAAGGRRNRGRMFMPPCNLDEGQVGTSGDIGASTVTAQQTAWTAIHGALTSAALVPVVLHSEPPFTPTPITAFVVQSLGATQRRRMRR